MDENGIRGSRIQKYMTLKLDRKCKNKYHNLKFLYHHAQHVFTFPPPLNASLHHERKAILSQSGLHALA
jgi:hypothetical protein